MIRAGKLTDLEAINSYDEFAGNRREEIEGGRLFVYEADGFPAGYVSFAAQNFVGHPYVTYLCVESKYRRREIGRRLLEHIEAIFAKRILVVSTESTNEAMLSLLKKLGYTYSGSLMGLNEGGDDEVFFLKSIWK